MLACSHSKEITGDARRNSSYDRAIPDDSIGTAGRPIAKLNFSGIVSNAALHLRFAPGAGIARRTNARSSIAGATMLACNIFTGVFGTGHVSGSRKNCEGK